jgi:hypothetical protein
MAALQQRVEEHIGTAGGADALLKVLEDAELEVSHPKPTTRDDAVHSQAAPADEFGADDSAAIRRSTTQLLRCE